MLRNTPLMEMCKNGSLEGAKLLINHEARLEDVNSNQWTALYWASMQGHAHIVDLLITEGAQIDKVNKWGQSALSWALCINHKDVVQILIERGVETKTCDYVKVLAGMEETAKIEMMDIIKDPHVLHWNNLGLNDSQLADRLNSLDSDINYTMLLVNGNKLKEIPKLRDCKNFKNLEVLNISCNQIQKLHTNHIPLTTKRLYLEHNLIDLVESHDENCDLLKSLRQIDLSYNNLETSVDISCYSNLEVLNLCHNNITNVNRLKLPVSISKIDLGYNKLKVIDDMALYEDLKEVNLQRNNIEEMKGSNLPPCIRKVNLSNNKIKTIQQIKLCKNLTEIELSGNNLSDLIDLPPNLKSLNLHMNPVTKIYNDCLCSKKLYSAVKYALSDKEVNELKQPPPEVLKSSFNDVKLYFDDLEDKEISQQAHNSKKRLVMTGPANAGKTSFVRSLIKGSPDSTSKDDRTQVVDIITYNITDNDIYQIFDQGGQQIYTISNRLFISNESTVFVSHNISNTEQGFMDETIKAVERALHQYPENEMHFLLSHIDLVGDEDNLEVKLQDFKQKIVELLNKEIDSVKLLKESEDCQMDDKMLTRLQHSYKEKINKCRYFPISSKTFQGIPEIRQFLIEVAEEKRVVLPQKWVNCYKVLSQNESNFITLETFENIFKSTYSKKGQIFAKQSSQKQNAMNCLRYFNACGLVLWYEENSDLQNHIFHRVEFLIDCLKSFLHHNLQESLKYDENHKLQAMYPQEEFRNVIRSYQLEGLLTFKLLKLLWLKYNLHETDEKVLLDLMKNLNICHEIERKLKNNDLLLFFPWFVETKKPPDELNLDDPVQINNKIFPLHLECVFHNKIPANVTELLIVALQKYAVENNFLGERYAWADGLLVKEADDKLFVYRQPYRSSLHICIQSPSERILSTWNALYKLYKSLKAILKQFSGAAGSLVLRCSHCKLNKISPQYRWMQSQCFPDPENPTDCLREVCCPNQSDKAFPSAVVVMVPQGIAERKEEQIKESISRYLQKAWIGKLYYFTSTLYPDPVMTKLFTKGILTNKDKQYLDKLVTTDKVEYLLEKVLLVGDSHTKQIFKEALLESEYHTNVALARLLDDIMVDPDMEHKVFITQEELSHMRSKFYAVFKDKLKVDETFFAHLVQTGTLYDDQHVDVVSQTTFLKKNTYLLDEVLFRGIWETVCNFRKALIDTNYEYVADLLPTRDDDSSNS